MSQYRIVEEHPGVLREYGAVPIAFTEFPDEVELVWYRPLRPRG